MAKLKEECVYIKLYFKQAKQSMGTLKMLKVGIGKNKVSEWTFKFKVGVNSAKNAVSLGCPVTAKQIKVQTE
jgi:hypothetical protein